MEPEAFEALLRRLDADREAAGERYEVLRLKLERFFRYRGAVGPDELADETLDRVGRRLARGEELRSGDPSAYALGVARNVLRESWQRTRRQQRVEEADADELAPGSPGEPPAPALPLAALAGCLARLPEEQRRLVLAYYEGQDGSQIPARRELAVTAGLGLNALRIRVHRIRLALEACMKRATAGSGEMETAGGPQGDRGALP